MTLPPLYLCRHGQTDWNAEERLQGQEEIDLNDRGRAQARRHGRRLGERLGSRIAGFRFLASPMRRTRETMEIIRAELGLDPAAYDTDARLIELCFGDWQGSTLSEIKARDPAAIAARARAKWTFRPPGPSAESYEMLAERVAPVFLGLSEPTVLVAHGGTIRSFLKIHGGVEPDEAAHVAVSQDRLIEALDGRVAWI